MLERRKIVLLRVSLGCSGLRRIFRHRRGQILACFFVSTDEAPERRGISKKDEQPKLCPPASLSNGGPQYATVAVLQSL